MNLGQPPSAEPGRPQIRAEPEPIPGQLALPGTPSPAETAEGANGQATLPGLELPTADDQAADARAADGAAGDGAAGDGAVGDGELTAVAAEAVIQLHAQASWIFRMAARRSSTDRVLSTGSR